MNGVNHIQMRLANQNRELVTRWTIALLRNIKTETIQNSWRHKTFSYFADDAGPDAVDNHLLLAGYEEQQAADEEQNDDTSESDGNESEEEDDDDDAGLLLTFGRLDARVQLVDEDSDDDDLPAPSGLPLEAQNDSDSDSPHESDE
jgi:hypothetical protein